MVQIDTSNFKAGLKLIIDNQPYTIIANQFVKPGKGQAFNRTKIRHLLTSRVIEKTFKSGEKFEEADVHESSMRYSYTDGEDAVFMDDVTYEQSSIPLDKIESVKQWLMEDKLYNVVFYNNEAVTIDPPMFLEMEVTETEPGAKGDTASGRVLKPCITESGAKVMIPIFISQGEIIKVDTRTGDYVSRAGK